MSALSWGRATMPALWWGRATMSALWWGKATMSALWWGRATMSATQVKQGQYVCPLVRQGQYVCPLVRQDSCICPLIRQYSLEAGQLYRPSGKTYSNWNNVFLHECFHYKMYYCEHYYPLLSNQDYLWRIMVYLSISPLLWSVKYDDSSYVHGNIIIKWLIWEERHQESLLGVSMYS